MLIRCKGGMECGRLPVEESGLACLCRECWARRILDLCGGNFQGDRAVELARMLGETKPAEVVAPVPSAPPRGSLAATVAAAQAAATGGAARVIAKAPRLVPGVATAQTIGRWGPRRGMVAAISVRQPWAWAIMYGGKPIENREWRTPPGYRGPLLIHAAGGCTLNEYLEGLVFCRARVPPGVVVPKYEDLVRGAVLGAVQLVGTQKNGATPKNAWALPGCLGLVLAEPRPAEKPEFMRGNQYLFEVEEIVWSWLFGEAYPGHGDHQLNQSNARTGA
jgi:hypothetical protein